MHDSSGLGTLLSQPMAQNGGEGQMRGRMEKGVEIRCTSEGKLVQGCDDTKRSEDDVGMEHASSRGVDRKDRKPEVSSVVNHLLNDGVGRFNDICVEDMPVCAIRNLVSRQMSMGIQILLQMLLVSEDGSECFER